MTWLSRSAAKTKRRGLLACEFGICCHNGVTVVAVYQPPLPSPRKKSPPGRSTRTAIAPLVSLSVAASRQGAVEGAATPARPLADPPPPGGTRA